jgi:hypothetical protein
VPLLKLINFNQMALRRALLDRMVAMMYHGYIMPVLGYMSGQASQLDESLIVHFSLKASGIVTTTRDHALIRHRC